MIPLLARCVHGLEWICAEEIHQDLPDAGDIRMARREVSFHVEHLDATPTGLRTADDLLLRVGRTAVGGDNPAEALNVAAALARLEWTVAIEAVRELRGLPPEPCIDVVAAVEGRRRYSRFDVENALGPLLALETGGRYLRRTPRGREDGDPDLTCRVFVQQGWAQAAVRVMAAPLHRRAYKRDTGAGTLHPPVAAAMVRLALPRPDASMLDPFCGDGTIVIEAALSRPGLRITGSDLDEVRLATAGRNAARAGVEVNLEPADAGRPDTADRKYDVVVTNPPWNVSVEATGALSGSLDSFWDLLPSRLTQQGCLVALTAAELDAPDVLRARGWSVPLGAQIRLAGRLSHLVVAGAPGRTPPSLPLTAATWRSRAITAGVVTPTGF